MSTKTKTRNPKACRVIVSVRGGVAELLFKPRGVEVSILDYDVDGEDADWVDRDPGGNPCNIQRHTASEKVVSNPNWPMVRSAIRSLPKPARRRWQCPQCDRIVHCTDESLAEAGTPFCADCDRHMELL